MGSLIDEQVEDLIDLRYLPPDLSGVIESIE